MGIYLPNMEMPIDGNETIIRIQPDGTVLDQYGHHLAITADPVPQHGRLIDADALIATHEQVCSRSMKFNLDLAPTIIEAEEG